MIVQKFLIISKTGNVTVRQTSKGNLAGNEIGLMLSIQVPDALFQRPILEATMKIPTEAIPRTKITPMITDNVEHIIKEATGLNMKVTIVEQAEESSKKPNEGRK